MKTGDFPGFSDPVSLRLKRNSVCPGDLFSGRMGNLWCENMQTPTTEDLLVMAVSLHGAPPEVVNAGRAPNANGRAIMKQALMWLCDWNATTRHALYADGNDPVVDGLYQTLIGMCRPVSETDFIAGFGNLGTDTLPPSNPTYVSFGVTDRGRCQAEKLFAEYPEYRSFKAGPDELP